MSKNNVEFYNQSLTEAVSRKDLVTTQEALKGGADVNLIDSNGTSILQIAVNQANFELAKLLLEHNANIEHKDKTGHTALQYSVWGKNTKLVELLLEHKANVNLIDSNGNSLLQTIADMSSEDDMKLAELLLKHNADIDGADKGVHDLIITAIPYKNKLAEFFAQKYILQKDSGLLIEKIVDNNSSSSASLLTKLLEKGANVSHDKLLDNALYSNKNPILIKILYEHGYTFKNGLFSQMNQDFYKAIFSNLSNQPTDSKVYEYSEKTKVKNTIFNNEGFFLYLDSDYSTNAKPINLEDGTPIGYNIHIPEGNIKAVLVEIYGGNDMSSFGYIPDQLNYTDQYLIDNGICIITLNLADINELGDIYQKAMPKDLHDKIHASIHKFYKTITNDPTSLHPDLAPLKDIPVYLTGSSFGGGNVERHAELYPYTFNGYISCAGSLSYEAQEQNDLLNRVSPIYKEASLYINPQNKGTEDKTPHLVIHNLDDNNVNLKTATHYYHKAKASGKKVQVLFHNQGSLNEGVNKGHFNPDIKEEFVRHCESILNFMTNGSSKLPSISDWMVYKYDIYANQNYKSATPLEDFISAAYRHKQASGHNPNDQDLWDAYYKPLYNSMAYIAKLKKDITNYPTLTKDLLRSELKEALNLSDAAIEKAVKITFEHFSEINLVQDKAFLLTPGQLITRETKFDDIKTKQFLINDYKDHIINSHKNSDALNLYLLKTLHMANPGTLHSKQFEEFINYDTIINNCIEARTFFVNTLQEEQNQIIKVWQELVQHVLTHKLHKGIAYQHDDFGNHHDDLTVPLTGIIDDVKTSILDA